MKDCLVSVVIPVYNVKEYLNQCVQSVLNQTYERVEILLIDDGSTDESGEICEQLSKKDGRILVYHKENGGLSSARNYGLKKAKGKYIYFLDSDDYIEISTIEQLTEFATKNELDIVCFSGQCFWDTPQSKQVLDRYQKTYKKSKDVYNICAGAKMYLEQKKIGEYYPAVPMHFYDLEFLKNYDLLFKDGILHEDELFSAESYYYANRVGCICDVLYWRRMRDNSIMTTKVSQKNVKSCGIIVKEIMGLFMDNHEEKRKMLGVCLSHCLWLYLLRFDLLNRNEKKACREEYSQIIKQIKMEKYYESEAVKGCFRKRALIKLRNNRFIHNMYSVMKRKR